ncbi:MAG: type II toxin-antitoxin system VapC family toxin [Bacteroidales bacterium]|nr:type II toxin-antitoxin system VapC family toxin [Bacteroidales bacterium]
MTRSGNVVLDASAVICLVRRERGWEQVAAYGSDCLLSAVNLVEVAYHLTRHGFPLEDVSPIICPLIGRIVPFDTDLALLASSVHLKTRTHGLSLADCACLALGISQQTAVVTADKKWSQLRLGVKTVQIR